MTTRTTTGTPSRASPSTRTTGSTAAPIKPASKSHVTDTKSATKSAASARATTSKTTTDHEAIRKWAEKRGGHPTSVVGTQHGKESAGVLRLDFGVKDEKLHAVDWDSFFEKFEQAKLAFLYQDKTTDGKMSRFHKFIHRH